MGKKGKLVGIAGRYCAGKDSVCNALCELGYRYLDIGQLRIAAITSNRQWLIERFGNGVLDDGGKINQSALSEVMLGDTRARMEIEALLYPWIVAEVEKQRPIMGENGTEKGIVLNDKMLLFMGLAEHCDLIINVRAPFWMRLIRGWKRDGSRPLKMLQGLYGSRFMVPRFHGNENDPEVISLYNIGTVENLKRQVAEVEELI